MSTAPRSVWLVNPEGKRVTAFEEDAVEMVKLGGHSFENSADAERLGMAAQAPGSPSEPAGTSSFVAGEGSHAEQGEERHTARSHQRKS